MDWTLAIDRQREALLRMLAALFVMAGGGAVPVLPRCVRTEIFRVLRPAEAAFRRLVVVYQQVMAVKAPAVIRVARPADGKIPRGTGGRLPGFALFDPRKQLKLNTKVQFTRGKPRIWSPGMDYPLFVTKSAAMPDDLVSATQLGRRLLALQNALADLPKQARRLARWEAKREAVRAESGKYIRPMRPGRPPGHRARGRHPVDDALRDCHALALYLLHPPDT